MPVANLHVTVPAEELCAPRDLFEAIVGLYFASAGFIRGLVARRESTTRLGEVLLQ